MEGEASLADYNGSGGDKNAFNGTSDGVTGNSRQTSDRIIFVDNLPSSIMKKDFINLFTPFAKHGRIIDVKFLKHKTGAETGYGFVEFEAEEDGRRAIQDLNWKFIESRNIRVSKAKPPSNRVSDRNLYVEGLPESWNDTELRNHFERFCKITEARVLVNRNDGKSRGVGFVHCTDNFEANKAIEQVHGKKPSPPDPVLHVKFAKVARKRIAPGQGRGGGHFQQFNPHIPPQQRDMPGGGRGQGQYGGVENGNTRPSPSPPIHKNNGHKRRNENRNGVKGGPNHQPGAQVEEFQERNELPAPRVSLPANPRTQPGNTAGCSSPAAGGPSGPMVTIPSNTPGTQGAGNALNGGGYSPWVMSNQAGVWQGSGQMPEGGFTPNYNHGWSSPTVPRGSPPSTPAPYQVQQTPMGKSNIDVMSPGPSWVQTPSARASSYGGLSHQLASLSISTVATPVSTTATADHRGGISPSYTNYTNQHYNYRVPADGGFHGMPQTPHTPQGAGYDQQWPITPLQDNTSGSGVFPESQMNWGWAQ